MGILSQEYSPDQLSFLVKKVFILSLPVILDKLIIVVPMELEQMQSNSLLVLLHDGALFGVLLSAIHDGTKKLRIPPKSGGEKLTHIGNS